MSSKDRILGKLRRAQQPFDGKQIEPLESHLQMVPVNTSSHDALVDLFIANAENLGCDIYQPTTSREASDVVIGLWGDDHKILAWDYEHIPLVGLQEMIEAAGVVAPPRDPNVRVGITGVDAALAATGSVVLLSGRGKHRLTSLLPLVHIAVVKRTQIIADMEAWVAAQRKAGLKQFRQTARAMIISGPSRTADIAMQLTMGMHGPAEMHIILVDEY